MRDVLYPLQSEIEHFRIGIEKAAPVLVPESFYALLHKLIGFLKIFSLAGNFVGCDKRLDQIYVIIQQSVYFVGMKQVIARARAADFQYALQTLKCKIFDVSLFKCP